MLKRILRIFSRFFLILLLLLVGFVIYFVVAVQISEPVILPYQHSDLVLEQSDSTFYKVGPNWLRKSKSGLWELYVEGNGYERGLANGLLTRELAEKQEDAFVGQIKVLIPDMRYLKFLRFFVGYFNRHLPDHISEEYKQEIYGISRFASDKYDFIGNKYQRILNYHGAHDIGHALQDKNMTVGCTAFSVWNGKSADGKLLVGRNFDFYSGDAFAENKIVQFTKPLRGYPFMTVTWAGFIGATSGMNTKGITVTINAAKSQIPTGAATPIALLAREILQYAGNIEEAIRIAKSRQVFVSESILVGSASDNRTVSIEKTPKGMDVYEVDAQSNQIICPNHYQGPDFKNDPANLKNICESSSLYRDIRMRQLLGHYDTINYKTVAAILRDRGGLNSKNIGLSNEKSINQLIAHHAVIFKPADGLVWVSANPYQCGEFVCYNLNTIFKEGFKVYDSEEAINDTLLSIPKDPFLASREYQQFRLFKELKHYVQFITKASGNIELSLRLEQAFLASNPESYYTYQILGDYYKAREQKEKAAAYYRQALSKEVATNKEKQQIEESLQACLTPVKQ